MFTISYDYNNLEQKKCMWVIYSELANSWLSPNDRIKGNPKTSSEIQDFSNSVFMKKQAYNSWGHKNWKCYILEESYGLCRSYAICRRHVDYEKGTYTTLEQRNTLYNEVTQNDIIDCLGCTDKEGPVIHNDVFLAVKEFIHPHWKIYIET